MNEHECRECGGRLIEQTVTRVIQYRGQWFMIEHVPAFVCEQCGAQYFTPDAHDRVVKLITSENEPVRMETVAVYDAEIA